MGACCIGRESALQVLAAHINQRNLNLTASEPLKRLAITAYKYLQRQYFAVNVQTRAVKLGGNSQISMNILSRRKFLTGALGVLSASVLIHSSAMAAPAPIICIDPGHPSETSEGAASRGLSENRLNWQVALRLKTRLAKMGIAAVLTKNSENQRVTNKRRAEIANGANPYKRPCALFIRLHCDEGGGRGFTWYYPDRAGRKGGVVGPPKSVQTESRRATMTLNEAMKPVLRGSLASNPIKTDAATFVGGKQGGVLTGSIYSARADPHCWKCALSIARRMRALSLRRRDRKKWRSRSRPAFKAI